MVAEGWTCAVCGGLTPPGRSTCAACSEGAPRPDDTARAQRPKATVYQEPHLPSKVSAPADLEPPPDGAPARPRRRRAGFVLTVMLPLLVGAGAGWALYGEVSPLRLVVDDVFLRVVD